MVPVPSLAFRQIPLCDGCFSGPLKPCLNGVQPVSARTTIHIGLAAPVAQFSGKSRLTAKQHIMALIRPLGAS